MKTIERIKRDSRVEEVWNEGDDGWWISLKKGFFCRHSDAHFVHETTVSELRDALSTVQPCACNECTE